MPTPSGRADACGRADASVVASRLDVTLRVDERYVAVVECAGRSYLFSRREVADVDDAWETVVRVGSDLQPRRRAGSELQSRRHAITFRGAASHSTLARHLNMSHNAAFECVDDDSTLVVYGLPEQ